MHVRYSKPKGQRVNHSTVKSDYSKFHRVPVFVGIEVYNNDKKTWWLEKQRKWGTIYDAQPNECYGSIKHGIHSVKSAIRHVRKHDEIQKGAKVRLVSNFGGYDIYITK